MSQEEKDLAAYNSNNSNNQGTCIVCYKNVDTYSIGMCEHPVCYECSTRMRVLCQQNECPICRQDLPNVVFTKNIKPYRHLNKGELFDSRYNIYFDDLEIQEKFTQLLAHVCPVCKDKQLFSTFIALKDHMRKKHELQYCDLCVENLKIFSRERRCYSRADLAMHRRKGDKDDKSHKGHPLCEFCERRYMDNDQLFRHLRRDHLYCHFCDADGLHQYYNSYDCLRDHFRSKHYLCEEGSCAEEKFTCVFRTDIDLKAHRANIHNKHLGKAAAKQARTLELEFTLAPRSGVGGDGHRNASKRPGQYNSARKNVENTNDDSGSTSRDFNPRDQNTLLFNSSTPRRIDVGSTEEFPTLGNTSTSIPHFNQIKRSQGQGNITIRGSLKSPALAVTDENFPALSGSDASNSSNEISKTVNFSIYNTSKSGPSGSQSAQCSGSGAPNVSIHVNHKISDGTITTKVSGPNIRIKPSQLKMNYSDFPALSSSSKSSNTNTVKIGQWTKVTCSKPQTTIATKKVTSRPASVNSIPSLSSATPPAISSGDAFPSLPNPSSRSKKTSSVSSTFQSTSSQSNRHQTVDDDSADQNTASSDAGKSNKKKKKKKVKDQSHESDDSKSTNSKSHANGSKVQNDNQPSRVVSKLDSNNKNKTNKSAIINNNNNTNNSNNNNHNSCVNSDVKKSETFNFNKESTRSKQNSENTDTTNTTNTSETANTAKKFQEKANELPRKRSELKIDNLHKLSDHLRHNSQDSVTRKQSSNSNPTNPPPGFGTTAPPPPGFAIKLDSLDVNSQNDGGLTFTNSLGESYSILPDEWADKSFSYVPPPDFQKRNKNLVTKISQVLDEQESIGDFRCISGLFKQGDCSAEDYYKHCRDSMGISAFGQIFPEMLVLLPDLPKQRKLYELFKKEFPNNTTLKVCPTCNQIVKSGEDLKAHYTSHTLDSHFPALAGGQTTSTQNLHTWVRKNT
ncbi:E3 ubiquitin-protein ligase ZNF598 [Chelonus insularis]|uniref:E3 ubiquitin-protein ligase ZNF598 n=1 Tax=Chelonus insularis TaxID=460826 RepID=UPI00158CA51A|nr:E3 ubiquitin-protein ligase ZNF598 [Chelonus insularis]XP_034934143.1 E3 ubiquitin-protein ligase ZNF598 [Chelonus insularis]